nr:phosphopantothenoylcysteine decarboxylase [Lachnospiraceae bacterium]
MNLKGKCVVIGVTGSIAAYKMADVVSQLRKDGADVHVILSKNATNFISPQTFETLSGNRCIVDQFDRDYKYEVTHVELAKAADCIMI